MVMASMYVNVSAPAAVIPGKTAPLRMCERVGEIRLHVVGTPEVNRKKRGEGEICLSENLQPRLFVSVFIQPYFTN